MADYTINYNVAEDKVTKTLKLAGSEYTEVWDNGGTEMARNSVAIENQVKARYQGELPLSVYDAIQAITVLTRDEDILSYLHEIQEFESTLCIDN